MDNREKFKQAFINALGITEEQVSDELEYNKIVEWDSIAHMSLISELEDAFNISMEADDIVDFSTYKKGLEILGKHNIKF